MTPTGPHANHPNGMLLYGTPPRPGCQSSRLMVLSNPQYKFKWHQIAVTDGGCQQQFPAPDARSIESDDYLLKLASKSAAVAGLKR